MSYKTNADFLLKASAALFKTAQTFEYQTDVFNKKLNGLVGKQLSLLAGQYLDTRGVSSLQVNVNYTPPTASFVVYATGSEGDLVGKEMANALNTKYSGQVSKLMAAYFKDKPFDYKFATFEK